MPHTSASTRTTIGRTPVVSVWICLLALLLASFRDPSSGAKEYEVKAAFLYNFAKFLTYPDAAFASAEAPFVIGVLGEDPFGEALDAALRGKKIGKRTIVIERYSKLGTVRTPHILFVARSESARQAEIVRMLDSRPLFLIGDMEGFAALGATANFFTEKNSLRFAISTGAAKTSRIQISAQLLKLAQVIP